MSREVLLGVTGQEGSGRINTLICVRCDACAVEEISLVEDRPPLEPKGFIASASTGRYERVVIRGSTYPNPDRGAGYKPEVGEDQLFYDGGPVARDHK